MNRRTASIAALALLLSAVLSAQGADTAKAAETRKKLQQKVTVDYSDTLLRDVMEDLKSQVKGLGIRADTAGGVSMNSKVSFKGEDITLKDAFEGIFKKLPLGYIVISKDGDAYDGTILIRQGKERGVPAGQETASEKGAKDKDKDKASDKTAAKDKTPPKEKTPPVEKPPEEGEKAEKAAEAKLRLAIVLQKDGKVDKAKVRYEEIIKQYPKSRAAEEAKGLLKELEK